MSCDDCRAPVPRRWLTIAQAADYLGLSVKGTYGLAAAGKLPAAHVGRLVRVDGKALEAELERQVSGLAPGVPAGRRKARAK